MHKAYPICSQHVPNMSDSGNVGHPIQSNLLVQRMVWLHRCTIFSNRKSKKTAVEWPFAKNGLLQLSAPVSNMWALMSKKSTNAHHESSQPDNRGRNW